MEDRNSDSFHALNCRFNMRLLKKTPQFSIWEPTMGTTRHWDETRCRCVNVDDRLLCCWPEWWHPPSLPFSLPCTSYRTSASGDELWASKSEISECQMTRQTSVFKENFMYLWNASQSSWFSLRGKYHLFLQVQQHTDLHHCNPICFCVFVIRTINNTEQWYFASLGSPLRRWSALKHSPFLTSFTM